MKITKLRLEMFFDEDGYCAVTIPEYGACILKASAEAGPTNGRIVIGISGDGCRAFAAAAGMSVKELADG